VGNCQSTTNKFQKIFIEIAKGRALMANIKQIAKLAKVSVATVSRVLNDHAYVSDDKRETVLQAIEQLNYSRNMNAINLIKGKTNVIGVMMPFVNHAYFSRLLEGISKAALSENYQLMLCQTNYDLNEELKVLDLLKMKQLDAVIICSRKLNMKKIEPYSKNGPIVMCEDVGDSAISSVYHDHYSSFKYGLKYLIERGHKHIGICLGRANGSNSKKRMKAYVDVLASNQECIRKEWMFYQSYNIEDGVAVLQHLLKMKVRPTALLVTSDQVAVGIILEAKKNGIRVPEDIAIIGFDNQPVSKIFDLTTIDNQLFEMGIQAFRIVHDQIIGKSTSSENRELEFRLVERSTV
jgi:LacI family purine nucleotide synthesis repressor